MVALTPVLLAASSVVGLSQAAAAAAVAAAAPQPRAVAYKTYKGDGTVAQGWPDVSQWASFDTIWANNVGPSAGACRWLEVGANSDAENAVMKAAIMQAGKDTGLDPRFILAAVYQESSGCVRMYTTRSTTQGYRNPGLLQSFMGEHTCNDPVAGIPLLTPCPDAQIRGMITDGVGLTTSDGLMQTVARSKATDVSRYYKGALLYNSGVMPASGNLGQGRSNPCYSSDIANRVMGWIDDQSPCNRRSLMIDGWPPGRQLSLSLSPQPRRRRAEEDGTRDGVQKWGRVVWWWLLVL
ncbi:uncharacterized protein B0I36DRAFT_282629 [Microdochium trichocladiopsis]|uniref:Uncharacterized protein n=1 Tax=Microdochium trichocladiopsis TaxID=1682393 RepID=A0A9P9BXG6_9PEZI|nr:uncharacterized protein B0I36DRAFT_282629 [Microdochium trichocladiopsis]KAH7041595.1 hypothetical protein B0I36DRAFT_282629 [Microdochium trichocladiopsis]